MSHAAQPKEVQDPGGVVEGVGKTTTKVWMRVGDSGWWRARIDLVPRFVAAPSVRELP